MKKLFVFLLFLSSISYSLDTTSVEESTFSEDAALVTMTGMIIPLALAGTIVGFVPPSGIIVVRDGVAYGGLNFETGIGFGDKHETGVFSNWRISVLYSYIVSPHIRDVFRVELKRDFHFDFVDRRKIFLSGFHISGGVLTNFPESGVTVGAGVWLKSPWLSFFGFMPQHTFGITYRYNKLFQGNDFQEISLGITSAFTF